MLLLSSLFNNIFYTYGIKKDDCINLADTTCIKSRWELFCNNLLNVHQSSSLRKSISYIDDPSLLAVELTIGKLKKP